jgi:hypothetical protein
MEAVLLASAVMVNLSGLLFESGRYENDNSSERDAITVFVILIIVGSLVYYVTAGSISVLSDTRPGFCRKPKGKEERRLRQAHKKLKEMKKKKAVDDGVLHANPLHAAKLGARPRADGEGGKGGDDDDNNVGMTDSEEEEASAAASASASARSGPKEDDREGLFTNPFLLHQRKEQLERDLHERDRELNEEEKMSVMLPEEPPPQWLLRKYQAAMEEMAEELRRTTTADTEARVAGLGEVRASPINRNPMMRNLMSRPGASSPPGANTSAVMRSLHTFNSARRPGGQPQQTSQRRQRLRSPSGDSPGSPSLSPSASRGSGETS